jgi:hypothetical protein
MMKLYYIFLVIFLVLIVSSCQQKITPLTSEQKAQIESEVEKLWEKKFEVLNEMDLGGLDETFSENEFLGYVMGGRGTIKSRQVYMDSSKIWWDSRIEQNGKFSQIAIHALAEDLALVDYTSKWRGVPKDGRIRDLNVTNTLICRKENTGWKVIYEHESFMDIKPSLQRTTDGIFKPLHLVNLQSQQDEDKFLELLQDLNAYLAALGIKNIKYQAWKMRADQEGKYQYIFYSVWPDQPTYDTAHDSEAFKQFLNKWRDAFETMMKDHDYCRYVPLN